VHAYIIRRILATIPVMLVVATFVFLLLHLTPGDPAAVIAGDYAQPEDIAKIRKQLGLDQPIYIQFGLWIGNLLQGDLALNWQADTWLQSRTGLRLEWLESNINAYSRDNWVISQTLTVTF